MNTIFIASASDNWKPIVSLWFANHQSAVLDCTDKKPSGAISAPALVLVSESTRNAARSAVISATKADKTAIVEFSIGDVGKRSKTHIGVVNITDSAKLKVFRELEAIWRQAKNVDAPKRDIKVPV